MPATVSDAAWPTFLASLYVMNVLHLRGTGTGKVGVPVVAVAVLCAALLGSCATGTPRASTPASVSSPSIANLRGISSSPGVSIPTFVSASTPAAAALTCPDDISAAVASGGDAAVLVPIDPLSPAQTLVCVYGKTPHHKVLDRSATASLVAMLNKQPEADGPYSCGGVAIGGAADVTPRIYLSFRYQQGRHPVNVTDGQLGCSFVTNGRRTVMPDGQAQIVLARM